MTAVAEASLAGIPPQAAPTFGELPPRIVEGGVAYHTQMVLDGYAIQSRVHEMSVDLAGRYKEVHALTVLNGGLHFASDLRRGMQRANPGLTITSDQIHLSSYDGTQPSGTVRRKGAGLEGLEGKNILVIEDVLDSGGALEFLLKYLRTHNPASVEVAAAFVKDNPKRRPDALGQTVLHRGFDIGNEFVIGYGMDLWQRYRDLSGIYSLKEVKPPIKQ